MPFFLTLAISVPPLGLKMIENIWFYKQKWTSHPFGFSTAADRKRFQKGTKRDPKNNQNRLQNASKKNWKITWFFIGFGTLFGSQNGSKITGNYTLGPLWVAVDSRWVASGPQGRLWVPFGSHLGRLGSILWSFLVILAFKIDLKLTMSYILYKNL